MTPERAVLIERAVLVVGFAAMTLAVTAFEWRLGLFFGGLLLALSSLDLRRRP